MNILLLEMTMRNFKGVKDFTIRLDGHNANLKGRNESGKTTVYDAFLFLFTGKDSLGSCDAAAFKPRTKDGAEIHMLDTTVEATLSVDGKPHVFKKILTENWVKKRGQEEQEFSGNTISCWIDEVSSSITEYKRYIDNIIPEETFKLITNSAYFMSMPWQKRREKLFEMAGAKSDIVMMQENAEFTGLIEILNGRKIDDYKKIVKARISEYGKQIEAIPGRIDENTRQLPDDKADYATLEMDKVLVQEKINKVDAELFKVQESLKGYAEKQRGLSALRRRREDVIYNLMNAANKKRTEAIQKRDSVLGQIFHEEAAARINEALIEKNTADVDAKADQIISLRVEWTENYNSEFAQPADDSFICPTCGQDLPAEQKENMIADAKAKLETEKAKKLAEITTKGQRLAREKQTIVDILAGEKIKAETTQKKIEELKASLPELNALIDAPADEPADYSEDPIAVKLATQITAMEAELDTPQEDKTAALLEEKKGYEAELKEIDRALDRRQDIENIKARIE
jgi:exonuclease SbcC